MQRVKRRIFSGAVCEQVVFTVPDRLKNLDKAEPRTRFKTEEERAAHKLGISRRVLAELCGISKSALSRYERGERVPTLTDAEALADFFEVSLDCLCGREK